jgi:S-adenosylmethionine hydrolase
LIPSLVGTYGDRPAGTLVALVGSFGLVEVAEVNGDAARRLEAGPGTAVTFRRETQN